MIMWAAATSFCHAWKAVAPEQLLVTFFSSAEWPSMDPIRWQSRNNPGEAGAHLHDIPPVHSSEEDSEKVICRKSHRGRTIRGGCRGPGGQ